jgi:hypothetical protein
MLHCVNYYYQIIYCHRNIDITSATIITRTRILERPAKIKMPMVESIHKRRSIDAIAWSGRGKIPIAQLITSSIRISHNVTRWLLIVKRPILGIEIPDIGA